MSPLLQTSPLLQSPVEQLATQAGLSSWVVLLVAIVFPVLLATLQHFAQKRFDSGQDARIARLQSELDEAKQHLQARLDVKSHVSRAQFDVEFDAYKKIWASLIELRNRTIVLRPRLDTVDSRESEEDRKSKRLNNFAEAYNNYSVLIDTNMPFCADTIYKEFLVLRGLADAEGHDYEVGPEFNDQYWHEAEENNQAIRRQVDLIAQAIRTRLVSVVITD